MKFVAIIYRRLKEGKTFDDYRKAWYHTHGFGAQTKMYTVINGFDPREIISIGIIETDLEQMPSLFQIDISERLANPLDGVIEQQIVRKFGVVAAEDDFSPAGLLEYKPPSVDGKEVKYSDIEAVLGAVTEMISKASQERDERKQAK